MHFYFQISSSQLQLSFNTIIFVETTLNVSVFMMSIIFVFASQVDIVSNVSAMIRNSIIAITVYMEENVFKVIDRIPLTIFVFVPLVTKDIFVNSACSRLASLSIHFW